MWLLFVFPLCIMSLLGDLTVYLLPVDKGLPRSIRVTCNILVQYVQYISGKDYHLTAATYDSWEGWSNLTLSRVLLSMQLVGRRSQPLQIKQYNEYTCEIMYDLQIIQYYMSKNGHTHTSSLKAFSRIISLLCMSSSLFLSQREPNSTDTCTLQKPHPIFSTTRTHRGQTLTKTNFINIFLTKPLAQEWRPQTEATRRKGQNCVRFIEGYCQFLMCLKVTQSKRWCAAIILWWALHFMPVSFIPQSLSFPSSPLALSGAI